MVKFLVINDFNDINDTAIRHFSLDKGHFMAKSLAKLGHEIYFLTTKHEYTKYGINYIPMAKITNEFVGEIDYILIPREPMLLSIAKILPAVRNKLIIDKNTRLRPKFIIKSDSPIWFSNKHFIKEASQLFQIKQSRPLMKKWIIDHVDYICAQNNDFCSQALAIGVPRQSLLISNMGISAEPIDYDALENPYDINHSYCIDRTGSLGYGKALLPAFYANNMNQICEFNKKKYIIVYTGRIKTDGGKILLNMKNIMEFLGEEFELHIFPGSFSIPTPNGKSTAHSGKNAASLDILRNQIFASSKNIIVHFPYQHEEKYKYLHFADCGIDFSDIRPSQGRCFAGHAKILEYCEIGLPVVCEEKIHNLNLVRNGSNGIILPYMASDEQYADAIRKIVSTSIDREYCRRVTVESENWDKKAIELMDQLEKQK